MIKFSFLNVYSLLLSCFLTMFVTAEEFKLSDNIVPSFQLIELTLASSLGKFSDTTTIDLNITKQSDTIKLYSKNLLITSATVSDENSKWELAVVGTNQYYITSLLANHIIPKGQHKLSLSFEVTYTDTGDGLFKVTESDETYQFTQFQCMLARSFSPSFDQPNLKLMGRKGIR